MDDMTQKPQRRRGAALETALLEAAWQELNAVGYSRFTMEGVAERAGTSRAVIYRRWPNRRELALATLGARFGNVRVELPQSGTLRDELIALLRGATAVRSEMIAVVGMQMGEFFAETGSSLGELRRDLFAGRRSLLDEIIDRAVARGEIDAARLKPRARTLPIDLLRHEMLMTLKPVPDATIIEIVDHVFLPLVQPNG
jgi:AcrR family transcriptional regulator